MAYHLWPVIWEVSKDLITIDLMILIQNIQTRGCLVYKNVTFSTVENSKQFYINCQLPPQTLNYKAQNVNYNCLRL